MDNVTKWQGINRCFEILNDSELIECGGLLLNWGDENIAIVKHRLCFPDAFKWVIKADIAALFLQII